MKTILFTAIAAVATAATVNAQDVVKTLYSGDPVNVTWENTLKIGAEEFAEGVNVGNYINVKFTETTDVLELKADGTWLPGSRYINLGDATTEVNTYLTADGLAKLQEYGLELCGANFTVSEVSVMNDGFNMPEGAIWGGYFWVENWNTLEVFKTAFDNYDGQRYLDIYLSEDNGDNMGYFMKVLTAWDNEDAVWANNDVIMHETRKAVVDLKDINVEEALADVNTLMVQSNPEGGNPYNITALVLREAGNTTDVVESINHTSETFNIYNLFGQLVKENARDFSGLNAGLYVANGQKVCVK